MHNFRINFRENQKSFYKLEWRHREHVGFITLWVLFLRGHAVEQLVEALRYKLEGRGFDSRWCHWNFSLT